MFLEFLRQYGSLCLLIALILGSIEPADAAARFGRQQKGAAVTGQRARRKTPAQSSIAFDEAAKRAAVARESGNLNEALDRYREAVRLRTDWAEGWWYLGNLLYELDRYEEARDVFGRFVALKPKGGPGWALLGLCEFQLRDYRNSLNHLQHARLLGLSENDRLTFAARYHASILLNRFGQFETALDFLSHYVRTQPNDNPLIKEALGINMLRLPYLPAELPAGQREIVLRAGQAAYYNYARLIPEAHREYEQLVKLYPTTPNVHYAYGIFLQQEKSETAIEHFMKELQISPGHVPARLQLAFAYINRDDNATGLPFAEEAVRLAPDQFVARYVLGKILLEMGEVARAVSELEAGAKLAPDSPPVYYALARAYLRVGRKQDAEQARKNFLRLDKIRNTQGELTPSVGAQPENKAQPR